jgi:hypothetical protein
LVTALEATYDEPLCYFAVNVTETLSNLRPSVVDTEIQRNMKFNFWPQLGSAGLLITPDMGARGQVDVAVGEARCHVTVCPYSP